MVIIVMGVSGAGKTTIGTRLADEIGCTYYDGDDFHPAINIEKMSQGIPLNDADRVPWMLSLRNLIEKHIAQECSTVISCSALKERYRGYLEFELVGVEFVHLVGSFETIWDRLKKRTNHFMKRELLQSQFDILEESPDLFQIQIDDEPDKIVQTILELLQISDSITV